MSDKINTFLVLERKPEIWGEVGRLEKNIGSFDLLVSEDLIEVVYTNLNGLVRLNGTANLPFKALQENKTTMYELWSTCN